MFVPETAPATVQEMITFLTPCIASGLFTEVVINEEGGDTVLCKAGEEDNIILTIKRESGGSWTFTPHLSSGENVPSGARPTLNIRYAVLCSGGVLFSSVSLAGSFSSGGCFVVGKTAAGKTACIAAQTPQSTNYSAFVLYPAMWSDNTSVPRYSSGINVVQNGLQSDRTILQIIPVFGGLGSVDYLDTVRFRNMAQYIEAGPQIIGGKQYGCAGFFAIKDEEVSA